MQVTLAYHGRLASSYGYDKTALHYLPTPTDAYIISDTVYATFHIVKHASTNSFVEGISYNANHDLSTHLVQTLFTAVG
jgi:hypothetical protein